MIEWGMPGKASVLVGGFFGSEGKGLIAAYLATKAEKVDVATTNAGAQAGHSTCYRDGRKFICYHLPTTAVVRGCLAFINGGSIIDIDALYKELDACGVPTSRVIVHPNAAVITPEDRAAERETGSSTERTGSTMKGVGQALSNKIMRRGNVIGKILKPVDKIQCGVMDLNARLLRKESIVVEVPQGMDLSINHGYQYPYCTSRDCFIGSGLSDAGIHPSFVGPICVVVRTFPIRVGAPRNEFNEPLGDSGPFYQDSREMSWDEFPGIEPERTTVTKRVRRIASWSNIQYSHTLRYNRPTVIALTFCDYFKTAGDLNDRIFQMLTAEEKLGLRVKRIFSFGPNVEDVTDDYDQATSWYERRSFNA